MPGISGPPNDGSDPREMPESPPDPASAPPAPPRVVDVRELLRGRNEVVLQHGSQRYRLRITRAGKLILTK